MRQRYIETVCRRELEIEDMVNRLFKFSKLDLSELPLDMQALDAAAEISAVTTDYADRADIDMRVPSGCTVYADRSQLRRIAKNIIDNSIKYAGSGRVRAVISAAERGDKVEFSFDDNGPGVPDEQLPRLFDVFYRTDPARKRGADGSGLGLAIVSRAAEQMGGKAEACRGTLGGLCIKVTLMKGDGRT